MNKYWIHNKTGQRVEFLGISPLSIESVTLLIKDKNDNHKEVWNKRTFEKQYTPITKAEYDSDITLEEIEASRSVNNSLEVGGNHYQQPIQVWDFVYANHIPFDEASVIKYICRHKQKNGAEDIKKAISYCKHILKTQYGKEE